MTWVVYILLMPSLVPDHISLSMPDFKPSISGFRFHNLSVHLEHSCLVQGDSYKQFKCGCQKSMPAAASAFSVCRIITSADCKETRCFSPSVSVYVLLFKNFQTHCLSLLQMDEKYNVKNSLSSPFPPKKKKKRGGGRGRNLHGDKDCFFMKVIQVLNLHLKIGNRIRQKMQKCIWIRNISW